MKTDDLIALLASNAQPVPRYAVEQRFALASIVGLAVAFLLMLVLWGVNPALREAAANPMFWGKFMFAGVLAAIGWVVLLRLARPGVPLGKVILWVAAPPVVMWFLAVVALQDAASASRMPLILGQTWKVCALNIVLLSLPTLGGLLWALRGAAPTRLRLTGAGAGLMAGALSALVYALHCPEWEAPFLAVWYVLGIALAMALGAWVGPRVLRW